MSEGKVLRPIDPDWPEARKLVLIATALDNGRTWAEVAAALRVGSAGEAKRIRRELEAKVRARQAAPDPAPEQAQPAQWPGTSDAVLLVPAERRVRKRGKRRG